MSNPSSKPEAEELQKILTTYRIHKGIKLSPYGQKAFEEALLEWRDQDRKAFAQRVLAEMPKKSYHHLRYCQTNYEEACTCCQERRDETIDQITKVIKKEARLHGTE